MSRVIAWVFVAGLAMLVVGLITATSSSGVALVLAGFLLLAGLAVVAYVKALRNHGATWDVNPGAARREAAAEREAREREAREREASSRGPLTRVPPDPPPEP
jgi:membrane protein implicated in regulation of membrane protease activity